MSIMSVLGHPVGTARLSGCPGENQPKRRTQDQHIARYRDHSSRKLGSLVPPFLAVRVREIRMPNC